jgi:hypothetical protein
LQIPFLQRLLYPYLVVLNSSKSPYRWVTSGIMMNQVGNVENLCISRRLVEIRHDSGRYESIFD